MAEQESHFQTQSIPIPEDCYINKADRRIYVKLPSSEDQEPKARVVVGRLASLEDKTFYPNRTFGEIYPDLWRKYFGTHPMRPAAVCIGIYAVVQHILNETGLDQALRSALDEDAVDAMLDCAVFAMLSGENPTAHFDAYSQGDQFLFGEKPYPEGWMSDFLTHQISRDAVQKFQSAWMQQCIAQGVAACWLCVGGEDQILFDIFEPERQAQSYLAAVCVEEPHKGMPLVYRLNNHGLLDWDQLQETVGLLQDSGIAVRGILQDFDRIQLHNSDMDYVVRVHRPLEGWNYMEQRYADEIRGRFQYLISLDGDLFAAKDRHGILRDGQDESNLCLYYSATENMEQGNNLRGVVASFAEKLETELAANPCDPGQSAIPDIPRVYQPYLSISVPGKDGCRKVVWNTEAIDEMARQFGYWLLASSLPVSAPEMLDLYHLRDSAETQFSVYQEQSEGPKRPGEPQEDGWYLAAFLAAILRAHFAQACRKHGSDPDSIRTVTDKLSEVVVYLGADGTYSCSESAGSVEQLQLLSQLGVSPEQLDAVATRVTRRYRDAGGRIVCNPLVLEKKGRGRPQGSKNKPKISEE